MSFEANLEYIAKELDNRNYEGKNYEYKFIPKDSLSFANIRDFACSKYVFLVDNFFPLIPILISSRESLRTSAFIP